MELNNFGGLSKDFADYKSSSIVILPVPFDKTSTWLKGADKGPQAIIEASKNMELYDIETDSEVYKKGIFTERAITAENCDSMISEVNQKAKSLLKDGKFVVILGGEHSVSIGAIQVYASYFKNISILHLDAHSDMRDEYEENKYSHACVMARAKESTDRIVSVGIRSMDSSELPNINKKNIFYASEIFKTKDWIAKVISKLSENVYITIDLDVFDSGLMPSTGTPEPGGLDWYQVTELLKQVAENKNIVGADVVELCPSQNKAPDFLAAKLVYKLLSYKFS
jgi:agmatinase